MVTRPSLPPNSNNDHDGAGGDTDSQETITLDQAQQINGSSSPSPPVVSSPAPGNGCPRVNHPPQPFPLPLQRRRSSASGNSGAGSPLGGSSFSSAHHPASHSRHSMPRLSITSLGSAAKSFRNIAAFIVPEEESEREQARERLRNSLRKGRSMEERKRMDRKKAERNRKEEEECRKEPAVQGIERNGSIKMRSSSAVPRPRPPQPNRAMARNGMVAKSREGSRSRSAQQQQNGPGAARTPSVPPQGTTPVPKNKRYANVKSKVGSLTDYTPPPSQVRIFHQPLRVSATPKVGSLQNASHVPAGGNVKIENRKLNFRDTAKPKVEAKSAVPIPKSDKKIPSQKLVWNAQSKVGSLDNAKHKPGGGELKIFNEPVRVHAESKVGSLDNVGHVPGGGQVKISDYSRSISGASGGGSVTGRSRRDTADSGRSSSSAGIPKKEEQQKRREEEEKKGVKEGGEGGGEAQLINFGD